MLTGSFTNVDRVIMGKGCSARLHQLDEDLRKLLTTTAASTLAALRPSATALTRREVF